MKKLSHLILESTQSVNECVVAAKKVKFEKDSGYVLVKHRDRAYNPTLSIIHTVVNGVEMVLWRDDTTLWMEGMNGAGIAIVNSALGVENDEKADKLMKSAATAPKMSMDGERIQKALTMTSIDDAVHFAKTWKSGIHGNTMICDGDDLYVMELTSDTQPVVTKIDGLDSVVRTNHGVIHALAGYQTGPSRKSSEMRKMHAENLIKDLTKTEEILPALRTQFGKNPQLSPLRKGGMLYTSSQIMLNPKKLEVHVVLIKKFVESFRGIINQLPTDFEPKIKITYEEI